MITALMLIFGLGMLAASACMGFSATLALREAESTLSVAMARLAVHDAGWIAFLGVCFFLLGLVTL